MGRTYNPKVVRKAVLNRTYNKPKVEKPKELKVEKPEKLEKKSKKDK